MSHPYFSIIIPTYNSYQKLLRAVKSIQDQSFTDFEIIIVDDGSTDGTKEKIDEITCETIRYFYKTNGGPASARNLGIQHASGEYICFLDADDEFMPDKLQIYKDACDKGALFLYSDAEYFNEKLNTSYLFSSEMHMKHGYTFKSLLENNFIVASTVCVQKIILENSGYFDESLKLKFVEDYDLWLKIVQKYPMTYIKNPLTRYYIHETNNSSNVQRTCNALIQIYLKWCFKSQLALKNLMKYWLVLFMFRLGIKK